ncbi:MAG: GNAT family N-acetyltransferase [Bacteroidota bacterium]
MTIRKAREEDIPQLLPLMRGLAEFEHYIHVFAITEEVILDHGFRRNPPSFLCFVAENPETRKIVGMLVYYFIPYTAIAKPTLYIKELFVVPEARNLRLGEALMEAVAREAVAHDCGVIKWEVAPWNKDSMRFYERLGAEPNHDWVDYSMKPETFRKLAGRD